MPRPILYYITDRTAFPGNESRRRLHLLLKIAEAARAGVDYIQLREKDLSTRDLELLAHDAVQTIREHNTSSNPSRLLINSRTDVALAVGADGVHLRSDDLSASDVRAIWSRAAGAESRNPVLTSVSCHTPEQVRGAAENAATVAIYAPVFEKKDAADAQPAGLAALRHVCQISIPVLALGGITLQNADACLASGAAGIAAIRLFQENDIATVVLRLRSSPGQ